MATNLELITHQSTSGQALIDMTDVFTEKYDLYCIKSDTFEPTTTQNLAYRLLDDSNTVISGAEYDWAFMELTSYSSYVEQRSTTANYMGSISYSDANGTQGAGFILYIHNPYSSTSFTFGQWQASSFNVGSGTYGRKGISVHHNEERIKGIRFYVGSGQMKFKASIYGVK